MGRVAKTYQGPDCPLAHGGVRYLANGRCQKCQAIASQRYAENNREKKKARDDAWRKSNPDSAKAIREKWRKANPEKESARLLKYYYADKAKVAARAKQQREKRKDKVKAYLAKWYQENKDVSRQHNRNRKARKKGAEGYHSREQIVELYNSQSALCNACKVSIAAEDGGYHVDHIMPLILGGSNWIDNIQLLCPSCNLSKGPKHPDVWEQERLVA